MNSHCYGIHSVTNCSLVHLRTPTFSSMSVKSIRLILTHVQMFVRPLFLKSDISTWPQLQAYNTNNKYSIHCEYRFQVPLSNFWERERERCSPTQLRGRSFNQGITSTHGGRGSTPIMVNVLPLEPVPWRIPCSDSSTSLSPRPCGRKWSRNIW